MEERRKFAELKVKYKATEHEYTSSASHLYKVLKKLDADSQLGKQDIKFLIEQRLTETLNIVRQMEEKRKFAKLKIKYKATENSDTFPDSNLYKILKKLDADSKLGESEIKFLREQKLTETLKIVSGMEEKRKFAELKVKYKATKNTETSAESHLLYVILQKLEKGERLETTDVAWLDEHQLFNGKIRITYHKIEATFYEQEYDRTRNQWNLPNAISHYLAILSYKYDVLKYEDTLLSCLLPSCPLYAILQKLEKGERLETMDVAWLDDRQLFNGKIRIAYHKIEATFYEQEYDRTGNKWNLVNASSHWRKAEKPRSALKVTENLNFNTIKENKLKSALLTTRGGAFRDLYELDRAEKCAKKAIEYNPKSHHPYTLMGAICFERGQHAEGERWFDKAIKRGASPRDLDAEMKRVVKNAAPNKRRELVEYLLKKDRARYAWAKSYLKKDNKSKKAHK